MNRRTTSLFRSRSAESACSVVIPFPRDVRELSDSGPVARRAPPRGVKTLLMRSTQRSPGCSSVIRHPDRPSGRASLGHAASSPLAGSNGRADQAGFPLGRKSRSTSCITLRPHPSSRCGSRERRRELIDTGRNKMFAKRDAKGQFKESDDVGRSLRGDRRRTAKTTVRSVHGRQGDRPRAAVKKNK